MAICQYNYTYQTYDPDNFRLEQLTTYNLQLTTIQDLLYNFDNVGNVLSITDALRTSNSQSFQYDDLNRLILATSDTGGYGTINYRYNSIGNMTQNGNMTMEYGEGPGRPACS